MTAPRSRTNASRLVARQVSELLIGRLRRWQETVGQDPFAGVVFDTVLSGSIAHLPLFDPVAKQLVTLDDALLLARPVTASAIAQSMRLPATTTRRRANELVANGQLRRIPAGYLVDPVFGAGATRIHMTSENAGHLARTIDALAIAGYAPAARALAAGVSALPAGFLERPMIAFELRVSETMTQLHGNATDAHLFSVIVAANIRHITADPALARRYADEDSIPPDAERRPVTLRAIARAIETPFETVRRRVSGLIAQGIVEQHATGVVVPTAVLGHDRHAENNQRINGFFAQMLDILSKAASQR